MVQLKTVLDKRRQKSDGTYPIIYRLTDVKKVYVLSSKISILEEQWDVDSNAIDKSHPNALALNATSSKRFYEIQKAILKLEDDFSFDALESGQLQIDMQPFNISDLLQESIEDAKLIDPTYQIVLDKCDDIVIHADKDKIASVITNLLSNAIKYSPKGSDILVSCTQQDDEVIINILDKGIGISNEDVGKLFERYYRVENAAVKTVSGFGIGLYLSAEIVKRHNGRIWVESDPGSGSTFYFAIPVK